MRAVGGVGACDARDPAQDALTRESIVSGRPLWLSIVQWVFVAGLLFLLFGWLARSRDRARPASESRRLRHPPTTLIVGAVFLALTLAVAVAIWMLPGTSSDRWVSVVLAVFGLANVPLIVDYFVGRHEVSELGMDYRKMTGARRSLRWSELSSVRYAPVMKWFRLETESGQVARVSAMLMGLPEFARLLLAGAPRSVVDADSIAILEATARGKPPPIW